MFGAPIYWRVKYVLLYTVIIFLLYIFWRNYCETEDSGPFFIICFPFSFLSLNLVFRVIFLFSFLPSQWSRPKEVTTASINKTFAPSKDASKNSPDSIRNRWTKADWSANIFAPTTKKLIVCCATCASEILPNLNIWQLITAKRTAIQRERK